MRRVSFKQNTEGGAGLSSMNNLCTVFQAKGISQCKSFKAGTSLDCLRSSSVQCGWSRVTWAERVRDRGNTFNRLPGYINQRSLISLAPGTSLVEDFFSPTYWRVERTVSEWFKCIILIVYFIIITWNTYTAHHSAKSDYQALDSHKEHATWIPHVHSSQ